MALMILRCILTGLCYNGYNEAGTLLFRAKGSVLLFEAGQGLWLFAVFWGGHQAEGRGKALVHMYNLKDRGVEYA
ncbi:MAG: hypothetical protein HFE60_05845 [Anaerotignum sp.]|jgi:hypothetical protein|nr:hypothetical protein [Anaerotignum sp.]